MIDSLFKLEETRERHRAGPLGPYVDDFVDGLRQQGYSAQRLLRMVALVSAFSRWLGRRAVSLRVMTPQPGWSPTNLLKDAFTLHVSSAL